MYSLPDCLCVPVCKTVFFLVYNCFSFSFDFFFFFCPWIFLAPCLLSCLILLAILCLWPLASYWIKDFALRLFCLSSYFATVPTHSILYSLIWIWRNQQRGKPRGFRKHSAHHWNRLFPAQDLGSGNFIGTSMSLSYSTKRARLLMSPWLGRNLLLMTQFFLQLLWLLIQLVLHLYLLIWNPGPPPLRGMVVLWWLN